MRTQRTSSAFKRYLAFGGDFNYPLGGWEDFQGSFDSVVDATEKIAGFDWWHIVDTETGKIVRANSG